MIATLLAACARVLRRTALPLAAYYGVTLALPVANGAARSGAFVEHAVTVLVVPPIVILFAYGAYRTVRGALADLLLGHGDPLTNIKLIEDADKNVVVIMKNGRVFKNALRPSGSHVGNVTHAEPEPARERVR